MTDLEFRKLRSSIIKNGDFNGRAWVSNGARYRRSWSTEHIISRGIEYIRDMKTGEVTSGVSGWNCAEYEIWGMEA